MKIKVVQVLHIRDNLNWQMRAIMMAFNSVTSLDHDNSTKLNNRVA